MTTRERVALQTSPAACITCHGMINPLGFGLERFDAVGRFRLEEKGKPVDATGLLRAPFGRARPRYEGARQLAEALAASEETHSAFVEQFFHHMVQQPIRAFGPRPFALDSGASFADHGFNVRSLLVEVVADSATPEAARTTSTPNFPRWPFSRRDDVAHPSSRREFLRDLGIGAAACRSCPEPPEPGLRQSDGPQEAAGDHVQPQRRDPEPTSGRDEEGGVHAQGEPLAAGAVQGQAC